MEKILLEKGFKEYNNCYHITIYGKEILKKYFECDADMLDEIEKGKCKQITLFVYEDSAEWSCNTNDVCVEDDYEGVLEFIKKYL